MQIVHVSEARYIKSRDGYWDYKYRIKLSNGQWKDKTVRGKSRKWKGTRGKQEAIKHFRQNSIQTEEIVNDKMMFKNIANDFLNEYEKNVTEQTARQEKSRLVSVIKYYGDFDMMKMTLRDISALYNDLFVYYTTSGSFSKIKSFIIRVFEYAEVYHNFTTAKYKNSKNTKRKNS